MNKIIFIVVSVVGLLLGSYFFITQNIQERTDKESIEIANQCLLFYKNNNKLPQLIAGKENKFLYDNEHFLLIYHGLNNSKTVIVANYKDDEITPLEDIWNFVDIFPEDSERILKIKYIYGNKIITLKRE